LLRKGIGVITSSGLKFNDIYYTSNKARKEGWFSRARIDGVKYIDIKYDQRNLNSIFIKDGKKIIEFIQTPSSKSQYNNLSVIDKESQYDVAKETSILGRDEANQNDADYYDKVIEMTREARRAFKNNNEKSKPTAEEKRENRKIENEINRKEEAIYINGSDDKKINNDKVIVGESSISLKDIQQNKFLKLVKNKIKE